MKIFLEVHYYTKDGKRSEFYDKLISGGIADMSRAEAGNEKYEYYFSPTDENELLLLEIWSSPEAVKLHGQTEHFKALGELKSEYVNDVRIIRSEITEAVL